MSRKKKTFEQSMDRLEEIVRTMEQGDLTLEESLKLFQEGTQLVRECGNILDEAQLQVTQIFKDLDGNPVEEAFSDE